MAKNGFFCIFCNIELSGYNRTMCCHCHEKYPLVKMFKSMRLPDGAVVKSKAEQNKCVYCIRGKCDNAFSLNLGSECNGDRSCRFKEVRKDE